MPDSGIKILVVEDEPLKRSLLEEELRAKGYSVSTAANPLEAEPLLKKAVFDVVLTDLRMPGQDGLSFLRGLKKDRPGQAVLVMTAYGSVETAIEAMKLGAFDYLQKPFATEELLLKLDRLSQYEHLASENEALRRQLVPGEKETRIVGRSESMRKVLALIHSVASIDTSVLIEGESGTGKELAARVIHETSHRAAGPFVAFSGAALPKDLVETELFGHEPGAFTGAAKRRIGRFELGHGGSLFLDDVDDVPVEVQVKLLRVLQDGAFERVGGEQSLRTNVRLIAATKNSLSKMVAEGRFREDLYYRLNVVPLHLPPLREHKEDIPLLIDHFLHGLALKLNRGKLTISKPAVLELQAYNWPGNVRELEHVLERMVVLASSNDLDKEDVPISTEGTDPSHPVSVSLGEVDKIDMGVILQDVESRMIRWALGRSEGNLARAADMLGIPRSTLQYKMGRL